MRALNQLIMVVTTEIPINNLLSNLIGGSIKVACICLLMFVTDRVQFAVIEKNPRKRATLIWTIKSSRLGPL